MVELEYYLNRQQVSIELFKQEWEKGFPGKPIPTSPSYNIGRGRTFSVKAATEKPTILEERLNGTEEKLKYALADEEKAIPFYNSLKTDIGAARELNPRGLIQTERETDRYLFSMQSGIGDIASQEVKHKERITNMLKAIHELRRTLELERITGKPQTLRPLERV